MAICYKCNRVLAANGSCLYCGTSAGHEAVEDRAPRQRGPNWTRRILLIALAGLLVHFFFFTVTGRGIVRPLIEATGLSKYISL
jgi:hypothetical protein